MQKIPIKHGANLRLWCIRDGVVAQKRIQRQSDLSSGDEDCFFDANLWSSLQSSHLALKKKKGWNCEDVDLIARKQCRKSIPLLLLET